MSPALPGIALALVGVLAAFACGDAGQRTPTGRIAFNSERDGNTEVYVMNADGSGVTNLTTSPSIDGLPGWSPDGSRIAFVSNRDGDFEIYVMDADGSDLKQLTDNTFLDAGPDWWSQAP